MPQRDPADRLRAAEVEALLRRAARTGRRSRPHPLEWHDIRDSWAARLPRSAWR